MTGSRRGLSRSVSPMSTKNKRSWQQSSSTSMLDRRESVKPQHSKFDGGRRYSPPRNQARNNRRSSRSRSPQIPVKRRRSRSQSPVQRPRQSPQFPQKPRSSPGRTNDRHAASKYRQRSLSPQPHSKNGSRAKKDEKLKRSRSPIARRAGPASNKKTIYSPERKKSRSLSPRGRSPARASTNKKVERGSSGKRRDLSPLAPPRHKSNPSSQHKVLSAEKKKPPRMTLHKRFTAEEQEPFQLLENVSIAILRNPNAEPSEEVTVKRVFDASLFKMVHKKTKGERQIFDREEIKIWRHDENMADDPDFERRLVRVKSSSTAAKVKPPSDSLSRMSPETLRKAFGLQLGGRSKSQSPHREQKIRLDPKPDPRYESKYRQQVEREEETSKKKKNTDYPRSVEKRKSSEGRRKAEDRLGKKDERLGRKEDEHKSGGREETYDLRQALDKRRNDRDDTGGFRIEVRRGERDREPSTELLYRDSVPERRPSPRRFSQERGRNVVVDHHRDRRVEDLDRHGNSIVRLDESRDVEPWNPPPRGRGGRGRGGRGRGGVREANRSGDWFDHSPRERDIDRGPRDRRPRYSTSPPNMRGQRGGFRGRGRGGRGREFIDTYDREEILESPIIIDDKYITLKHGQHDDRDISPKMFRGRGGRGRFASRGFGSTSFRATTRGFRGGAGFRGNPRGRGAGRFNDSWISGDRRSVERMRDPSLDREWKHDMYDSLQGEVEEPHSTTVVP